MTATLPANPVIHVLRSATVPLLALNNAHAVELSHLTLIEFNRLIQASFSAAAIEEGAGFLIAFDQTAAYDSPNFLWFRERYERFVYVDRVVTSPLTRGKGYAKALYADLFQHATSAGHSRIVCEVNLDPPNPVSDAFHAALDFTEVGRAPIHNGQKTVRYLHRSI